MLPDVVVGQIAERQHGVFRRDQALRAGIERDAIARRLGAGAWVREHRGVYRPVGCPLSWEGAVLAACWAGGVSAMASHRTAARIWDLPGQREATIEITCERWRRKQHVGLEVHESTAIDRWDVRVVDGVPVSSPERTLLDLGAVLTRSTVEIAVDVAVRRELTSRSVLAAMLGRLGRSGRNGAGVLRSVLGLRDPRMRVPESPMETRLIQVLRRQGLPAPEPQYEIYDEGIFLARVDAAYPTWRIAIEYESLEWHTGSAALVRGSSRRNRLIGAGWQPVTATHADIRAGGGELAAAVRALIP